MSDRCIRYGKPAEHCFRALEVRTLHVRGLTGENRVQALGNETQAAVCDDCARMQLERSLDPVRAARPQLIAFGLVFLAGIAIEAASFLFLNGERVFALLGLAALICGSVGFFDALRGAKEKRRTLHAMPHEEALEQAAWDVYLACAPKKENDDDLTYIPIDEKTLARKNGDLMVMYKLLPEIAVEAWKRIHGQTAGDPSGNDACGPDGPEDPNEDVKGES